MRSIQYAVASRLNQWRLGVLDRPPEPVIGRRVASTRWRAMTAESGRDGFGTVIARSEATKQSISRRKERMDCFVASAPRNDVDIVLHAISFSRREAPELCQIFRPRRAWGMPGARCTRGLVCTCSGRTHTSNNEYTGIARHSRTRVVLTVSFALSPVTGLFCHRHRRSCLHRLDTSVGVSGPHDFVVRVSTVRQRRISVHRIPHPTSVTIAKRPSQWDGMAVKS